MTPSQLWAALYEIFFFYQPIITLYAGLFLFGMLAMTVGIFILLILRIGVPQVY